MEVSGAGGREGEAEGGGASLQGVRSRPCSTPPPAKRHEQGTGACQGAGGLAPDPGQGQEQGHEQPPPPLPPPRPEGGRTTLDCAPQPPPPIESCLLRDPAACEWHRFLARGARFYDRNGTLWPATPLNETSGELSQGRGAALGSLEEQREGFLAAYAHAGAEEFRSCLESSGSRCGSFRRHDGFPQVVGVMQKHRWDCGIACALMLLRTFPQPPRDASDHAATTNSPTTDTSHTLQTAHIADSHISRTAHPADSHTSRTTHTADSHISRTAHTADSRISRTPLNTGAQRETPSHRATDNPNQHSFEAMNAPSSAAFPTDAHTSSSKRAPEDGARRATATVGGGTEQGGVPGGSPTPGALRASEGSQSLGEEGVGGFPGNLPEGLPASNSEDAWIGGFPGKLPTGFPMLELGKGKGGLMGMSDSAALDALSSACGTESVWTIDLAYLMRRCGLNVTLVTLTFGVNQSFADVAYYTKVLREDMARVARLFLHAPCVGIHLLKRSMTWRELALVVAHRGQRTLIVCLVDKRRLNHEESEVTDNCWCCGSTPGYIGHYILICGFDADQHSFLVKDPASESVRRRTLLVPTHRLDAARKEFGTDEDVLIVSSSN